MLIKRYRKKQRELKKKKNTKLDILDLGQGLKEMKDEDPDFSNHFMDVFDKIFKEKYNQYIKKEMKAREKGDQQMFNFAKKKILEIEKWVEFCYLNEKQIDQQRMTKLDNEGAAQTASKV